MKAFILIGIPGAGKSTWAYNNRGKHDDIFSADDYRMVNGVYQFKKEDSPTAHARCLRAYAEWLVEDSNYFNCFVDNTNCTLAEVAPYIALGLAYGVDVRPIHIQCDFCTACSRNVHGVPRPVIAQLQENLNQMLRTWPSYWPKVNPVTP